MSVPIVLWGVDSTGNSFIEKTQTVVINRRGAKALTKHSLVMGARVKVAVPHLKRASAATVAWSGTNRGEFQEVGIDLGQIEDFWSMPFPEDTLAFRATLTATKKDTGSATPNSWEASGPELEELIMASATPASRPSAASPEVHTETSDKLFIALRELTRSAIEQSQGEVLQKLNRHAEEGLNNMQRVIIEEAQEYLHRATEDAGKDFETRVLQVVARNQQICEQTLQRLVLAAQATQERLEASLAEYQKRLATSAQTARRELARTLADLSGTIGEA
ncbi:MAG: hypothetical protein A3G20_04025 [Acidobacteria bacterium RIFCSPLOWO2_12_FULL_59_11]|nr:MAG: hypothetical protein A3G20_04025 [Acidobacteria bacterium RIFCSPLOWO2_12_FULL_59_11]